MLDYYLIHRIFEVTLRMLRVVCKIKNPWGLLFPQGF